MKPAVFLAEFAAGLTWGFCGGPQPLFPRARRLLPENAAVDLDGTTVE